MPGEYPRALSVWDMESVRAFVRLVAAATELRMALSASVGDGGALMAAAACAATRSAGVVKFTAHARAHIEVQHSVMPCALDGLSTSGRGQGTASDRSTVSLSTRFNV